MQAPHLTTPLATCICASLTLKVVWQNGHWVRSWVMAIQAERERVILPRLAMKKGMETFFTPRLQLFDAHGKLVSV
jgi:hypothetical protein